MKMTAYEKNGTLYIKNLSTDSIEWSGRPKGYRVQNVIELIDSDCSIVLLDPSQESRTFQNLLYIDCEGSIVWEADLPDTNVGDVYLKVLYQDNCIIAYSWSGFKVEIDSKSGKIISREFVK